MITDKIRKLLAMAEGGSTEQERATFLEKAQALMVEHAVSEAMLRASGQKNIGEAKHRYWFREDRTTLLIKAKRELLAGLATIHRCKVIRYGRNGRDAMGIVGFESDMDNVATMFASIMLQLQTDMDKTYNPVYGHVRGYRVSFAHGYVRRVYARLEDAQRRQMANATEGIPGSALVLRDQSQLVIDKFNEMFPSTRTTKITTSADTNHAGYAAGDAAGQLADLGGARVGSASANRVLS
jgi:hypothetical protein